MREALLMNLAQNRYEFPDVSRNDLGQKTNCLGNFCKDCSLFPEIITNIRVIITTEMHSEN